MKKTLLFILLFALPCAAQISLVPDRLVYKDVIADCNVYIGNLDEPNEFQSHVKMEFWGENFICLEEEGIKGEPVLKDEVIELGLGTRKLQWLKSGLTDIKWVETLYEKPVSNEWSLRISDGNQFNYIYQRSLAEKALNNPGSRLSYFTENGIDYVRLDYPPGGPKPWELQPLDVDCSIAVYHKTKKDNYIGYKNYGIGKVLHIPRPKATDADGKWVWCDIRVENGIYTRTILQKFLDEAVYPVVINDTFGVTNEGGGASGSTAERVYASAYSSPEFNGSATSITLCTWYGSRTLTLGIYDDSGTGNTPGTRLRDTGEATSVAQGWIDPPVNFDSALDVLAANSYWLAWNSDTDGCGYKKDDRDSGDSQYAASAYVAGVLPATFPSPSSLDDIVSIYVNYTPSGVTPSGQVIFININ